jgi:membrane fusion protein
VALVVVQVPETVSAPFTLVPVRGADPVRSLHDGLVTAVRVNDAEEVEAGATLFVIDSEIVGDRSAERLVLGTTIAGGETRLVNERQRYDNQRRADEQEQGRLAQRITALDAQAELKERQAVLAREMASRLKRSYDEGLTSWIEASKPQLDADRLTVEAEQVRADSAETRAALARLRFEIASRKAAFDEVTRSVQEEVARSAARKGLLDGEASRDGNRLTITAPCRGTIVRLLARNPGTVVHSGEALAEIACAGEQLHAELRVPQRGLALVANGQPVKLRYDAFPFQRYGVRYATLRWLSPSSSVPGEGASFRALADLDGQALHIAGQDRPLRPGMGGQASIIVGRRSLASYAIEPLRQMREAMAVPTR